VSPAPAGRTPVLLISIVLLAASAGVGCGGGDARSSQQGPQLSDPINLADCRDWNAGSAAERLGTIHGIRNFLGAPVPGTSGHGATITDEQAYRLFEGWCGNHFARGFKLYKLYARAAAFQGLGQ
jgi:hypothetical protein